MKELAELALRREYWTAPIEKDEWNDGDEGIYLDGRFSSEELKAIAWCVENKCLPVKRGL